MRNNIGHIDLKSEDGLLDELEKIVGEVESGQMSEKHAKIRLFAAKEAVRIMALKLIRERFNLSPPGPRTALPAPIRPPVIPYKK